MNRYRIIKDGYGGYNIQERLLFRWSTMAYYVGHGTISVPFTFNSIKKAEQFIDNHIKVNEEYKERGTIIKEYP